MFRSYLRFSAILFGIVFSTVSHSATTNDLAVDWSTTANPNGPWSYRDGSDVLPNWPTACCLLPAVPSFAPSDVAGTFLPIFFQASGPGSDVSVHSYDPTNGQAAQGEATLVWTSSVTGFADVAGYYYYDQSYVDRSNDITIRLGSTVLTTGVTSFTDHANSADAWNFSFNHLAVVAGEELTVTFVRSAGETYGTITSGDLIVTATPVPEAPIGLMMPVGLLTLALVRRAAGTAQRV